MFRECYFEYAGRYSGDYNLIMSYVNDTNDEFDSGGKYEPKTDTRSTVAESILYSVDYSENQLEFTVEVTNVDEAIPFEQMTEIKEWLCAHSGWKKLKLESPDYQDYYLLCLLIPEKDIADGLGYRGIRCTLRSISGFWYRDEATQVFTQSDMEGHIASNGNFSFQIDVKTDSALPIYPIIECKLASDNTSATVPFFVKNTTNGSVLSMALSGTGITNLAANRLSIDSQFPFFYNGDKTNYVMSYAPLITDIRSGLLYLSKGINDISVACHTQGYHSNYRYYEYFQIHYVSKCRIGGF